MNTNQLSDLVDRVLDSELPVRPNEPSLLGYYGDLRTPQLLEHPLEPGPCRFSPNSAQSFGWTSGSYSGS